MSHIILFPKSIALAICLILAAEIPTMAQSDTPAYAKLTDEQKELLNDALETSKTMASESKEKLTDMLNHWQILKDNFPQLPRELQDAINKVENDGFTAKVNYTLGKLNQFEDGLKEVTDAKEDLEKVIDFYGRYAPDSENPFRSLEVMSNFFNDVLKLLPKEQEYEAIKDPVTFMMRTGMRYFRDGIDLALGGLKNIQKQVRDRAANCIGYIGGDGTADSSDPKRKAFTDLGTGNVICYSGVRPVGGEIWTDETGNAVYIWSSGKWSELRAGFGLVTDIFSDWRLAYESVITAEEMILWGNINQRLYTEARDWGHKEFTRLAAMDFCREDILEKRNKYSDWMSLRESVNTDRRIFVAKYIFNKDGIREATKTLTAIMYDNVLFRGIVEDRDGERISNASVTIKTLSDARSDETTGGMFSILMEMAEASRNGSPIEITVMASGYPDLKVTSRIYTQCQDLGVIRLVEVDTVHNWRCGPYEIYDPVAGVCYCIEGYVRNAQGICVEEDAVPDIQAILNNSDCSAYPNTHPVWDNSRNEAFCDCLPGYSWKPDYSGCDETGKLLASQADCSGYPNTQPVWDDVNKIVICDCLPGYVWDQNFTQCYPQSLAQLSSINCGALANTMPVWDPLRLEAYCDCLPGFEWRDDFSGCDQITTTQIIQPDCSYIPNSQQVYDPASNVVFCDCMPGFEWNSSYTACVPERKKPAIDMNMLMDFMTLIYGGMNPSVPDYNPGDNNPASQQPAVVHQSRCNDTQKAGGDAPEVHQIDLGMTSGVFSFDYQTFDVKDQIIISQGGMTIFNSGCVGESRSVQVQFSGYTSVIEVRVNPNCAASSGTAWNFTVHCPGY
jgi:hypothetical protein